jgi:hypothetical protein
MVPLLCTCLLEVGPKLRPPEFWRLFLLVTFGRNSSGGLAMFAAIRRASSPRYGSFDYARARGAGAR